MKRELQETADGSHTLFIPEMDEHYHSGNGAVQESRHVFIEAGLHRQEKKDITVFEVGFGTGLNAYLTLLDAENEDRSVDYFSVELYPLDPALVRALNYGDMICPEKKMLFTALHSAAWNEPVKITDHFTLHKIQGDNNSCTLPEDMDLIYFDAFAPEKQPEMWSEELFRHIYAAMNNNGILTTYCAKGIIRRLLQAIGFRVERLPGPPGGKREILRASKTKE